MALSKGSLGVVELLGLFHSEPRAMLRLTADQLTLQRLALAVPALLAAVGLAKQYLGTLRRDPSLSSPVVPVHYGLPFLGSTLSFVQHGGKAYAAQAARLGLAFQTYLFGEWTVVATGPGNMHKIYMNEYNLVVADWPEGTKALLGEKSVSVVQGSYHASLRRMVQPAFLPQPLSCYSGEITEILGRYLERWVQAGSVVAAQEIKAIAFEVACVAFFHMDFSEEKAASLRAHFTDYTAGLFLPTWTSGFKRAMAARRYIQDEVGARLEARMSGKEPRRNDLLQKMLDAEDPETGAKMSMESLKDQALVQLFAGHDTTAGTMTHMLWQLSQNPEIAARALEEQREVMKRFPGASLSLEALDQMPFLDGLIMECLRIKPPVTITFRRAVKSFELQDGFGGVVQVPKGAKICVNLKLSAENMEVEQPQRCMPERWLGGKRMGSVEHLQMGAAPFAAGKRKCLGFPLAELESRLFGAMVLRRITYTLDTPGAAWTEFPIPTPTDGMPMRVEKRSDF